MYSVITHNKACHWFRKEEVENWRDALHIEDSYTSCVFDALSFLSNPVMIRVLETAIDKNIDLNWATDTVIHQPWPSLVPVNVDHKRIEPDWLILDNEKPPKHILAFEAKGPSSSQKGSQIRDELAAIANTYRNAEINMIAISGSNLHEIDKQFHESIFTTSWLSILESCETAVANIYLQSQDRKILMKLIELLSWFGWRSFHGFEFKELGLDPNIEALLSTWRIT